MPREAVGAFLLLTLLVRVEMQDSEVQDSEVQDSEVHYSDVQYSDVDDFESEETSFLSHLNCSVKKADQVKKLSGTYLQDQIKGQNLRTKCAQGNSTANNLNDIIHRDDSYEKIMSQTKPGESATGLHVTDLKKRHWWGRRFNLRKLMVTVKPIVIFLGCENFAECQTGMELLMNAFDLSQFLKKFNMIIDDMETCSHNRKSADQDFWVLCRKLPQILKSVKDDVKECFSKHQESRGSEYRTVTLLWEECLNVHRILQKIIVRETDEEFDERCEDTKRRHRNTGKWWKLCFMIEKLIQNSKAAIDDWLTNISCTDSGHQPTRSWREKCISLPHVLNILREMKKGFFDCLLTSPCLESEVIKNWWQPRIVLPIQNKMQQLLAVWSQEEEWLNSFSSSMDAFWDYVVRFVKFLQTFKNLIEGKKRYPDDYLMTEWWEDSVVAGQSVGRTEWWQDSVVAGQSVVRTEWWEDSVDKLLFALTGNMDDWLSWLFCTNNKNMGMKEGHVGGLRKTSTREASNVDCHYRHSDNRSLDSKHLGVYYMCPFTQDSGAGNTLCYAEWKCLKKVRGQEESKSTWLCSMPGLSGLVFIMAAIFISGAVGIIDSSAGSIS